MKELNQCCCCSCSLRTGTIIIAVLCVVWYLGLIAITGYNLHCVLQFVDVEVTSAEPDKGVYVDDRFAYPYSDRGLNNLLTENFTDMFRMNMDDYWNPFSEDSGRAHGEGAANTTHVNVRTVWAHFWGRNFDFSSVESRRPYGQDAANTTEDGSENSSSESQESSDSEVNYDDFWAHFWDGNSDSSSDESRRSYGLDTANATDDGPQNSTNASQEGRGSKGISGLADGVAGDGGRAVSGDGWGEHRSDGSAEDPGRLLRNLRRHAEQQAHKSR